jgi:aspartyl-tRNA(Asn)/glutamyl-tRNA(Gln) amidotransferase subunit A
MNGFDAWLMPGCPISAPAIDSVDEGDPILSTFTRVANHLGGCALSLPAGVDELGLPVGVQLVGPAFGEAALIAVGHAVQQVTNWHRSKG